MRLFVVVALGAVVLAGVWLIVDIRRQHRRGMARLSGCTWVEPEHQLPEGFDPPSASLNPPEDPHLEITEVARLAKAYAAEELLALASDLDVEAAVQRGTTWDSLRHGAGLARERARVVRRSASDRGGDAGAGDATERGYR